MKYWNNHRGMKLFLVGVFVISINPLGAFAANYYVATTGNNSNSGTIGSPFRTLEKAASVMSSGDTMFIRGGTYQRTDWDFNVPSGNGSWATATIIKAYNGEKVILTPQNPAENGTDVIQLPRGKSYIIFDGLILDGLRSGLINGGRQGFRFADGTVSGVSTYPSHHVRISNTEIRNTYNSNILTTDAHTLEFINLHLHHAEHNNKPGYTGSGPYGIYMESGNNLVVGCDIHHSAGYGIHQYSGHSYQPSNNIFMGNILHENGKSGIIIARGTGAKFINNVVYGNGTGGSAGYTGESRYGIEVILTPSNVALYNNTVFDNAKGALLIGPSASNVIAKNNIFYGTNASDYTVRIYALAGGLTPATLTNNTIYHANASFCLLNQGAAAVSNNILGQNPLFLDAENSIFHLQPGSPAIGKGIVLNEVKYDFDNVQRNQPYDIGAYAFVSSSLPVIDSTPPSSPKDVQVH